MRTNDATRADARSRDDITGSLFGDGFWGRERVNPGPAARLTTRAVTRRG